MGAAIIQQKHPVAYWSCKLTGMQNNCQSTTIKASPGTCAFSHDMLLNIPLIIIACNHESLVNDALLKANQWHVSYDYEFSNTTKQ